MDTRQNPSTLRDTNLPVLPRCVGVDGRFTGKLQRFPGFYTESNWAVPSTATRYRYFKRTDLSGVTLSVTSAAPKTVTASSSVFDANTKRFVVISTTTNMKEGIYKATYVSPTQIALDETPLADSGSNGTPDTTSYTLNEYEDSVSISVGGQSGAEFFESFSMQSDARQDAILRGWLILCNYTDSNSDVHDVLVAHYYHTGDGVWYTDIIADLSVVDWGASANTHVATLGTAHRSFPQRFAGTSTTNYSDSTSWEATWWDANNSWAEESRDLLEITLDTTDGTRLTAHGVFSSTDEIGDGVRLRKKKWIGAVQEVDATVFGSIVLVVGQLKFPDGTSQGIEFICRRPSDFGQENSVYTSNKKGTSYRKQSVIAIEADTSATPTVYPVPYYNGEHLVDVLEQWVLWEETNDEVRRVVNSTPVGSFLDLSQNNPNEVSVDRPFSSLPLSSSGYVISKPQWVTSDISPGVVSESDFDTLHRQIESLPRLTTVPSSAQRSQSGFTVSTASTGMLTNSVNVTIAYRLVAPEQGWYSSLSNLLTINTGGASADRSIEGTIRWPPEHLPIAGRKIVQVFRSTEGAVIPGTSLPSGQLFLEKEYEIPSGDYKADVVWGTQLDSALNFVETLTAEEASTLEKSAAAKFVQEYDNILFRVHIPEDNDFSVDLDALRWGPLGDDRLNYQPFKNKRSTADHASQTKALEKSGSFLALVQDNEILRIHRSGTRLAVDTIHNRHGVVSHNGVFGIANQLYMVSPIGLLVVDLRTGDPTSFGAVQHIFDRDWRASLSEVHLAYDSALGALIAMNTNTSKREAVVVWMNEGVANTLESMPWDQATTGPEPTTGGSMRAWFLNNSNRTIYRIDVDSQAPTKTMNGGPSTVAYNTTVTQTGTTSQVKIALNGGATLADYQKLLQMPLVVTSGTDTSNSYVTRYITGVSESGGTVTLTLNSPLPGAALSVGDKVSLAPIPFRIALAPIRHAQTAPDIHPYEIKKAIGMSCYVEDFTNGSGSPNDFFRCGMVKEDLNTILKEGTQTIKEKPSDGAADVQVNRHALIPIVEQYGSNLSFSLTMVGVSRIITQEGKI